MQKSGFRKAFQNHVDEDLTQGCNAFADTQEMAMAGRIRALVEEFECRRSPQPVM